MTSSEAKFILGAFRPDGRDATDPLIAEALAQAAADPELQRWFERQRVFDVAVCRRLEAVAPPSGLKEAILAGGRASRRRRWFQPRWLALAAMLALGALGWWQFRSEPPATANFAHWAIHDLRGAHYRHESSPAGLQEIQARLATMRGPLPEALQLEVETLQAARCRVVNLRGREVFELCFRRDGAWFHLYVARRESTDPWLIDRAPFALDHFAAMSWSDAGQVYALVTSAGQQALERLL